MISEVPIWQTNESFWWQMRERFLHSEIVFLGKDRIAMGILTDASEWKTALKSKSLGLDTQEKYGGKIKYAVTLSAGDLTKVEYGHATRLLTIEGNVNSVIPELPPFLYAYSEVQRQEDGKFTLHAAAASKNEEAVLILGNKGAGKTSLVLELCAKHGYKLVGNDVLIVGETNNDKKRIGVHCGDGVLKPRKLTMDRFPEFASVCEFDSQKSPYDAKAIIDPANIGIEVERAITPITKVVQIFLNADESALTISRPEMLPFRLNLHENASRYIKGAVTPLMDFSGDLIGSMPSFDRPELARKRATILERLITEVETLSISGGNIGEIANYLARKE